MKKITPVIIIGLLILCNHSFLKTMDHQGFFPYDNEEKTPYIEQPDPITLDNLADNLADNLENKIESLTEIEHSQPITIQKQTMKNPTNHQETQRYIIQNNKLRENLVTKLKQITSFLENPQNKFLIYNQEQKKRIAQLYAKIKKILIILQDL